MQINYCDLCNSPLKEGDYFMLYVSEPKNINHDTTYNYYDYLKKVQNEVKEVCPKCKYIFDKMFELKLQRLTELTEEINLTFNLQSKSNTEKKKDEKK